ncbi:putative phage cell wall peptidase, NlpC/P60 family [Kaistia soli DSM 19436]|uniref:Putative phage cell wall peptidase, NlpC/P60 family n=1 Tax=Kaistia soli DSM 19436 TaxID=1122133 RepID=A0A1M4UXI8_9HYPH|nr:NlpC/P60 family protein [Kaistia soli]SHE61360.1 putative phage cell wall peptidase, NlpC/P60 family [Kaistia soli DSM 19436]
MAVITRDALVDAALGWLGTPYRHQASLKGVGADCLGLVRGVWREVYGDEPEPMPAYTPDWAEARGNESLRDAAARHMTSVDPVAALPGDLLLFRWREGLPAKHAAILAVPGRFIHAHDGAAVAMASLTPWWARRLAFAFSFPGVTF